MAKPDELPTSKRQSTPVPGVRPETTRDFYIEKRNGNKRDYVYDVHRANRCSHPRMVALSIGGNWYRCEECNYAFDVVAAYAQPLHNLVIGSLLNAMHFAKEFGRDALEEVVRTPIGQYDGTPHKPVLPEGMTFEDTLLALEAVDVNSEDGGKAELEALMDHMWVSPAARKRRLEELPDDSEGNPHPEQWKALPKDPAKVPGLQARKRKTLTDGDTGES